MAFGAVESDLFIDFQACNVQMRDCCQCRIKVYMYMCVTDCLLFAETTPKASLPVTDSDSPFVPQQSEAEPPVPVEQLPPSPPPPVTEAPPHSATRRPTGEERTGRVSREQRGPATSAERRRPPQSKANYAGAPPARGNRGTCVCMLDTAYISMGSKSEV